MNLVDYILISLAILSHVAFGKLIFRFDSLVGSLLAGLMVSATIGEVLLRIAPLALRFFFSVECFAGFGWAILNIRSVWSALSELSRSDLFRCCLCILASAIGLSFFHYNNFPFESHSVLYFDAVIEGLKADYFGNVRVSAFYPIERAALHVSPAAFLGALNVFISRPTLVTVIESRYIASVIFLGAFVFESLRGLSFDEIFFRLLVTLGVVGIYGNFLNYCLYISSFCYVFILMELVKLSAKNKMLTEEFCVFSLFLLTCKSTILPLTFLFSGWVVVSQIKNKSIKSFFCSPSLVLTMCCVCASVITWRLIPQGAERINDLNIIIPQSFKDFSGLESFYDPFAILMKSNERLLLGFEVVGLVFLPLLVVLIQSKNMFGRIWIVWCLSAILGLVFVRINGSLKHVRHVYFFAGVLVLLVAIIETKLLKIKKLVFFIFATGTILWSFSPGRFWQIPYYQRLRGPGPDEHFLTYNEFVAMRSEGHVDSRGFYMPSKGEPYWKTELVSAMSGSRVEQSLVSPNSGQNMLWFLTP